MMGEDGGLGEYGTRYTSGTDASSSSMKVLAPSWDCPFEDGGLNSWSVLVPDVVENKMGQSGRLISITLDSSWQS